METGSGLVKLEKGFLGTESGVTERRRRISIFFQMGMCQNDIFLHGESKISTEGGKDLSVSGFAVEKGRGFVELDMGSLRIENWIIEDPEGEAQAEEERGGNSKEEDKKSRGLNRETPVSLHLSF